jgi:hypothetical protein
MRVPPELMTQDERGERVEEVRRVISREWLRFAVTEAIVLWLPFTLFLVAYVSTDAISDGALVPVVVAGIALSTGLVLYWFFRRIRPLQAELEALEQYGG